MRWPSGRGKDQSRHHINGNYFFYSFSYLHHSDPCLSEHHKPIRQVHGRSTDHQAHIVPPWMGRLEERLQDHMERHILRSSALVIIHLTMEVPLMGHRLYRPKHHVLWTSRRINRDMLSRCHPGNSVCMRMVGMTHRGYPRLLRGRGTAGRQLLWQTLGYPLVGIPAMMTRLNLIRRYEGHIVRGSV